MNTKLKEIIFQNREEALDFIEKENQILESIQNGETNSNARKFIAHKSEYKGFEYYIVRHTNAYNSNAFYLCGYVVLDEVTDNLFQSLFKLLNKDYKDIISCHGGLTYEGNNFIDIQSKELMIGFDCSHAGDIISMDKAEITRIKSTSANYSYKTFYFVEDNCRSIIDQLIEISTQYKDCKNGREGALQEINDLFTNL